MGTDGADLSCPGSGVVTENQQDNSESRPLIKSPDEELPEKTHQEETAVKEKRS